MNSYEESGRNGQEWVYKDNYTLPFLQGEFGLRKERGEQESGGNEKRGLKSPSQRILRGSFPLRAVRPAMWENPGKDGVLASQSGCPHGFSPPVSGALILCVPKCKCLFFFLIYKSDTTENFK